MRDYERFKQAYITAALWSSMDNSNEQGGEPLDKNYSHEDFAKETIEQISADCFYFWILFSDLFDESKRTIITAGMDFWLTRGNFGAGFWDGDWEDPLAEILTKGSKMFNPVDLYIGDDGLIYQM